MSLADCLQRAIDNGMSRSRGRMAQKMFADRLQANAHLGPGAEAAAAEDVWRMLRKDFLKRKRTNLMQAKVNSSLIDRVAQYRDSNGTANAANAPRQLLEYGQSGQFNGVVGIADALKSQYMRNLTEFVGQHKRNIIGNIRNRAKLKNIVRELHGENTGDVAAKELANAISSTLEMARSDFNAAGGSIAKLDGYGLPHSWEVPQIRRAGFDKWAEDMDARLDWMRMIDNETTRPFTGSTPERRMQFLREIYDNMISEGHSRREPSGVQLGRSTANSRSDHRIFHFKSADDWMAVNNLYGRSDAFSAVISHIDMMSRDTALMRVLGPNPRLGLEFANQTAQKLAAERPWKQNWISRRIYSSPQKEAVAKSSQARAMYDLYTGAANKAEADVIAGALSGTRHFLLASQLGGAMLSAVGDVGFMEMASRHIGMDFGKVMGRHIKAISSSKQRGLMVRAGIIADAAANVGVVQSRLMGDAHGPSIMERLSEFTMRASGLTAWTDIGRGAWRLETYGFLADHVNHAWSDLPDPLRELFFKAHGITEADWDIIRTTKLFTDEVEPDAKWLIPGDIRYRTDIPAEQALELSLKLEAAVLEQMEFAVPSASLRGRAMFQVGAPGTFWGEMSRSGLMYKSYAFSMMFNQVGRVAFHKVRGSRTANIAMFATFTTVAGAFSIQMKELAKGNDPRPMNNGKFLIAAGLQGGGLGIFGDFANASQNRFGGGIASTALGPGVGFAAETGYLIGDIVKAVTGQRDKDYDRLGRSATKFLNRYSGPTNVWYVNAALDRLLWDNLQELVDGNAQKSWRRAETRRANDYGNNSFWPHGQALPERMPNLSNVIGATK